MAGFWVQLLKMAGFGVQLLKMAGVPLLERCPRSSFPLRPAAVLLINISDGLDFLGGRTPAHWSDQPWDKFIFQEIEKMWVCKNTRWDNILDRPLPFCLPPNFSANAQKKTFFMGGHPFLFQLCLWSSYWNDHCVFIHLLSLFLLFPWSLSQRKCPST